MFESCIFDQPATPDKWDPWHWHSKSCCAYFRFTHPFLGQQDDHFFNEFLGQTNGSCVSRETSSLHWPEVQSIYWGMMLLGHTSIHSDVRLSMEVLILQRKKSKNKSSWGISYTGSVKSSKSKVPRVLFLSSFETCAQSPNVLKPQGCTVTLPVFLGSSPRRCSRIHW